MDPTSVAISKKALWTGYVMSALPALALLMSAVMKLIKPAPVVQGFAQYGFSESSIVGLGILELICTIVYLIPRTSVLGAILLTGYLGGAVAANLRVGKDVFAPAILGILFWGGVFMRDTRLRELLPLKRYRR
jgi:hypothetical protein